MKQPTLAEVQTYIADRKSPIDPVAFHAYYSMLDWKCCQGKTPMKNWHMAVIVWEQREKPKASTRVMCPRCADAGTLPSTGEPCSCKRGGEAREGMAVMAKIKAKALKSQMAFPQTKINTRRELYAQAKTFLAPEPPKYEPTLDFEQRRSALKEQAERLKAKC